MAAKQTDNDFPFIVSSGPKLQNDPAVRQLIRKQAMRDVGIARKRKGTFGKQNIGQLPSAGIPIRPVVGSDSGSSSNSSRTDSPETSASYTSSSAATDDTDVDELFDLQLVQARRKTAANQAAVVETISLLSEYETARSRFNIDIADLSMLTNFNVGKSTISVLSADPSRLAGLLGQQQWSYLQYVPSLYGESACLTAAADCVLAKVSSVLAPSRASRELALRLYAKALHRLQKAISSEKGCLGSDVLCATEMLSLHELLDTSRESAWSHHVNGAVRIVKHRGPRRFASEFDKACFAAHVGTAVSESLLANEHCYLEEPKWTALYLSMMQESDFLTDRSPLTLKVRLSMFKLPGIWHDVDVLVASPRFFDEDAVAELGFRCRTLHDELLNWTEDYKAHCVRLSLATPTEQEIAMRRELFGTSIECLILAKRLLATMCEAERIKLESETQALAHLIFDLQKKPSPKHSWLFTGHETGVSYTILSTREQWEEEVAHSEMEQKLATRQRYITWSRILRMSDEG